MNNELGVSDRLSWAAVAFACVLQIVLGTIWRGPTCHTAMKVSMAYRRTS